eukprot:comp23880_c0_seq1/m.41897 comp23880_c0_seq1/g.41897  ORF comp23880_c0_seq1/g.41897 comp23880_c0_seq1/m.41897 type:complete len:441 (-) comp23880_c0_seq1:193-1515(-)
MAPRKKAPLYDPPPWVAPPPAVYVQAQAEAPLQAEVAQLRGAVQDTYATFKQTNGAGAEQLEQAARALWNVRQIVADLRQRCASGQHEVLPGAVYVTAAICTGALLASRRPGYVRRLLYPTVSLVAAGGLFYPTITKQAYVELYGAVTAVDWQGGARQAWQLASTTAERMRPEKPVPEPPAPVEAATANPAPLEAAAPPSESEGLVDVVTGPSTEHAAGASGPKDSQGAEGTGLEGVDMDVHDHGSSQAEQVAHEGGHVALPAEDTEGEVPAAEGTEAPAPEKVEVEMPAAVDVEVPASAEVPEVPAPEKVDVPAVEVPAVEVPAEKVAEVPAAERVDVPAPPEGVGDESIETGAVSEGLAPVAVQEEEAPREGGHEGGHVAGTVEDVALQGETQVAAHDYTQAPAVVVLRAPVDGEVVEQGGDPGMSDPRDKHMYTTRA